MTVNLGKQISDDLELMKHDRKFDTLKGRE